MSRPGLVELEAVLAIVQRGSFHGAALELGLSTTALSNAIAKLERGLGVRLFNRTTRSVSLTDAGRTFVAQVGPALQDIHAAFDVARSHQATPSGTLRINAFAAAAREVFAPVLLAYLRRYPEVHVDLVTEGRLVDIVADGFDLGIRGLDLVPTDMIAVPLGLPRRNAVVASPAYLKAHGAPKVPPDLLGHACIRVRLPDGSLYRWRFEKDGQPLQMDVAGPLTLDEVSLVRCAVLADYGIGYVIESDVRDDIAAGRLVHILQEWTPDLAPLCLYYPSRKNQSAAFKALVAMARELGGSMPTRAS
ncbi:MAG: LysR family transcriptional regulator [Acetobacteraceae bacterium]|nr:LysR family transcriptional regulator [Pseudomonadota bacterium]